MRKIVLALSLLVAVSVTGRTQNSSQQDREPFADMHIGLFAHYTFPQENYQWGGTEWADGSAVQSLDELADLQAAVKDRKGGGVAWSFGPHPGGRWELGVPAFCDRLGKLIGKTGPSLFGTQPSKAYVTIEDTPLTGLPYAATESLDGQTTYLHVFNPPKGRSLQLPVPADGRYFSSARILTGEKVKLVQDASGVTLTVRSPSIWGDVDTIIEL